MLAVCAELKALGARGISVVIGKGKAVSNAGSVTIAALYLPGTTGSVAIGKIPGKRRRTTTLPPASSRNRRNVWSLAARAQTQHEQGDGAPTHEI